MKPFTVEARPAQRPAAEATDESAVTIADCEFGKGLFAARPIAAGETILRFTGPLIGLADTIAKGDTEGNPLQVGPAHYIDLEPPGVFVNHSCTPNAGIRDDVLLTALRPLAAGEHVCCDYSTTMWEADERTAVGDTPWAMRCRCGSAQCRGTAGEFPTLPAALREHYLALGIVQRFIVERMRR